MSRPASWLLIPPVSARLRARYRHFRQHGASGFSAALGCFWMILAWMFIPLEHPRWQQLRAQQQHWFPHINPDRPRPLDPARYLIQAIWLVVTSPRADRRNRRGASVLPVSAQLRERCYQWLDTLPEQRDAIRPAIWITIKSSGISARICGVLSSA